MLEPTPHFMNLEHEVAVTKAFILRERRDRVQDLLSKPKRRRDVLKSLAHFRSLDPRWMQPIPPHDQQAAAIEALLRRSGAAEICYVIAEDPSLDGRELPLSEALRLIVGRGQGAIVSCLPGVLAYYEGEEPGERYILSRRAENRQR